MCGIAGIFDLSAPERVDRSALQRMNDAIAHRGPDGEGLFLEPGIGLAHRRLAIIDLATGDQPMFNADGSVAIVFNGEIYNFHELTRELAARGYVFRTHSDTEAIVHAWEEWGVDCVSRLRGMFSFAIYDRKRQSLFLARDRLGKKPLYYTIVGGRYCFFGSELKALLASGRVDKTIAAASVDDYLAFGYVPDPATIYCNVFKLPPAHCLLLTRGKAPAAPIEYWTLSLRQTEISENEAAEQLIDRLSEAVRIRLMSEVPLGAFLSGGVDSSGVVAMMARQSAEPVETFAIGIDGPDGDELPHAERVSRRYGTDHIARRAAPDLVGAFRSQAVMFDEPFADISSVPTAQVCQLARSRVTVALSGDAGDEVFAGYRRYRWHGVAQTMRGGFPAPLRGPLFGALGNLYPKLDRAPRWLRAKYTLQEMALDEVAGYYRNVCKVHDHVRTLLYSPAMRAALDGHHPGDLIARHMQQADSGDPLARAQYVDIKTYLPGDILTKVDRTSMASSLEVRVPMLDHLFVEWAASLPSRLKLRHGVGKYILKRALEPYVPRENLYRNKRGFAASADAVLRGAGARPLREALLGDAMGDSGLFDRGAIERFIEDHESGRANHGQALWALLMFSGFLQDVHFTESYPSSSRPEIVDQQKNLSRDAEVT
jgi:asparagine synthase (glutamine-hydrolysing)